jgi:hypothetical protein
MTDQSIIEDAKASLLHEEEHLHSADMVDDFLKDPIVISVFTKFAQLREARQSSQSEPVAEEGFQVTMSNTPMYKQAYDLIQSIESLGASPELTAVVTQAGKLMDEIVRREINFHHVCKAFNELNAPTFMGEPKIAAPQQAIPSGNHLLFDAINKVIRVHGNGQPKQMDDAVMLLKHALSASPTAPIESDK